MKSWPAVLDRAQTSAKVARAFWASLLHAAPSEHAALRIALHHVQRVHGVVSAASERVGALNHTSAGARRANIRGTIEEKREDGA